MSCTINHPLHFGQLVASNMSIINIHAHVFFYIYAHNYLSRNTKLVINKCKILINISEW